MIKKSNVEVRLISLQTSDVIATSLRMEADLNNWEGEGAVSARGYYDDEEDF